MLRVAVGRVRRYCPNCRFYDRHAAVLYRRPRGQRLYRVLADCLNCKRKWPVEFRLKEWRRATRQQPDSNPTATR